MIPQAGTYQIVAGFNLSSGGSMTMTWNVTVAAPTPTVHTSGNVVTTATSVQGAQAFYSAYGSDAVYGTYGASCTPASGSTFPPGTTTVQCSATNGGGKTGTANLTVTVNKATPDIVWSPGQVVAGRPLGSALNASVVPAGLAGSITYDDGWGNPLTSASVLQANPAQTVRAIFTPSGQAATAYTSAALTRQISVVRLPQSVDFGTVRANASVDDTFDVTAAGTAGGGDVTISTPSNTCDVVDRSAGTAGAATVTVTRNGTCLLEARQAQTASYSASLVEQHHITVARRTPVISWTPAEEVTYGATLAGLLDATTDAPGTWAYQLDGEPVSGATVPAAGDDRVLRATFTPADPDRHTSATTSRSLDVLRAPQQLEVAPLADRTYGQAPFDVDASSQGPGAVSVAVGGPCSVAGSTVTPTAAGACEVTVTKSGDANHLPISVVRTVAVAKGTPDLAWSQPEGFAYGHVLGADELDAVVSAVIDEAAAAPVGELAYTLDDGTPAAGALLEPGTHRVHVRWEPTGPSADRWKVVTGTVDVTVAAVLPSITWDTPASIVHGTALGDDQLDATTSPAGATGTIDYFLADGVTPARGVVLAAGQAQQLIARYEPDAAATGRYLPAWSSVAIDVTKAPQSVVFGDLPTDATVDDAPFGATAEGTEGGGDVTISASADSACTVVDDSDGTEGAATVTVTRNGPCVLEASQAETGSFSASPVVQRSVTVARRTPVITWSPAGEITHGDTLADLLDASTDAAGTWTYRLDGDVVAPATVPAAGQDRALEVTFTPTDPDRYTTATAARTLDVLKASQAVTLGSLSDRTYGDPAVRLVATGGPSGSAITYAADGACSVDGTLLTLVRAGACAVTATQGGSGDYDAAGAVTRSFTIARAPLSVVAPSHVRRYGAANPVLAPVYTGLVNGDTVAGLAAPATCTTAAVPTSPAGTHPVTCAGAASPNYAVTAVPGHLRVRYGLRGLSWSLGGGDDTAAVERGSRTPVRVHLRDAEQAVVPRSISADAARACSITLTVGSGDPTCFRYDRRADRLVAMLDTEGLARGTVVRVTVAVRAADGTLARRRVVDVRVR